METAKWVGEIGDDLAAKLANVDLIAPREKRATTTLGTFLSAYIAERSDVKAATRVTYRKIEADLLDYFSADRDLQSITPGDADVFARFLATRPKRRRKGSAEPLSAATIHRRLQEARAVFRAALRKRLIAANPFADVKTKGSTGADRQRFISGEATEAILEACPNTDWRSMVALCRFGGLRFPSEVLSLRWSDVDWANHRIIVTSPKTAHHRGKGTRKLPMFPELRRYLNEAWEALGDNPPSWSSMRSTETQRIGLTSDGRTPTCDGHS